MSLLSKYWINSKVVLQRFVSLRYSDMSVCCQNWHCCWIRLTEIILSPHTVCILGSRPLVLKRFVEEKNLPDKYICIYIHVYTYHPCIVVSSISIKPPAQLIKPANDLFTDDYPNLPAHSESHFRK